MVTTVKIDKEHKRKLERFLASRLLERGEKLSIQKVLGEMVDHALECKEFAKKLDKLPPLEKDPAWIALHNPVRTGVKDLSEDIDKYLYGGG